jgi:diguanylate cyclase (GGDEF)-like protein/PAS domain S-box-containing protein
MARFFSRQAILSVRKWPLRAQLSVLSCALLAVLLSTFLWAGYRAVQGALLEIGGDRANVAAHQLAILVAQYARMRTEQIALIGRDDALRDWIRSPTPAHLEAARARARLLTTTVPQHIAVWNAAGTEVFEILLSPPQADAAGPVVFPPAAFPSHLGVHPLTIGDGTVFAQTVAPIVADLSAVGGAAESAAPLGFLVVRAVVAKARDAGGAHATAIDDRSRTPPDHGRGALVASPTTLLAAPAPMILAGPEAGNAIGRLVGAGATTAVGNMAGGIWTDLLTVVTPPPELLTVDRVATYERADGTRHVGALVAAPETPWAVWVEFPQAALLSPARALLRGGLLLTLGCLIVGALLVTTVTARAVRPLDDLAHAAHDVAAGNYTQRVYSSRSQEIGQLADVFNAMTARVEDAHRAVTHVNERTQFALEAAQAAVWEFEFETHTMTWSAAMAALYGLTPGAAPRTLESVLACIHQDDRAMVRNALALQRDYIVEFRIVRPDNTVRWVNSRVKVWHDVQQRPARLLGVSIDITDRRTLEESLFAEKERAQVTLHSIGDAVISTDPDSRVTYLNAVAEHLTGWSHQDASGRPLLEVFNIVEGTTREAAHDPSALAIRLHQTVELGSNCVLIRRDGSEAVIEDSAAPIHDRSGNVTGAVITFRDVSLARAQTLKIAQMAHYDALTNLPNRTLFHDRLNQATTSARRNGTRFAVLFVDVDGFKSVNDALGHAVGDALLQSVTARLLACVRASDTVSRHGGDEFVLLLPDLKGKNPAAIIADKIIAAFSEPYQVLTHAVHVTASIGISIYPDDALDAEGLISAADAAMYHAKQAGRNNSQFFTNAMNLLSMARRSLETSLRQALRRQEFVLHYQLKVDLDTSAIVGMEALVRWQHPTRGLLAPGEFVSIAEDSGLIQPIGRWVLREACRQARAWQEQGLPVGIMAVNVSAVEVRAQGFLEHVTAVLEETGWAPQYLELELTESVLMAEVEATTFLLRGLKNLGVRLAIDDFGTGYSSLSYLSRFPVDTLKIDRSFVHGMTLGEHDAGIIDAIIAMGRSLGRCVIAEGVETAEQLSMLKSLRCAQGQGFYFNRPVVAAGLAELLRRDTSGVLSSTAG